MPGFPTVREPRSRPMDTHIALWETDEVDRLKRVSGDEYAGPRVSTRR
ncbi:hypothetical protein GCM10018772_15680 [Streptomyces fumanus]|uniref:Uncharacterized protein n=1 Tax=Streptomyces fumanus TaxID=67302 RepID=A0A919DY78_9ACTN|nr:hypothetical protein GCM10018772_15680 [Streptomyces fumanus]